MRDLNETNLTDAVLARLTGCQDPRLRKVTESLVRHLHAFIREVEPTQAEWMAGIRFLTATGQKCDDKRQEYILLSDTLGVSTLVDEINNRRAGHATENSLLGPFYVTGAPERISGENIALTPGDAVTVTGRVLSVAGQPIAGATLDVWQTAANGLYDVQDAAQPSYNLRGKFRTNNDGEFEFRTTLPSSYPIPTDGPVGRLMQETGRHPYRPAHIHFIVAASGFKTVVTELFVEGDPYLESDAVFGVKSSLVVKPRPDARAADGRPISLIEYDFGLEPA